jgi:hypothetical protein
LKEEWRVIEDFPIYEVSNFGRVRSNSKRTFKLKNPPYISQCLNEHGYKVVGLCKVGKKATVHFVHRLVLEAFKAKRKDGEECNHMDGNRINNLVNNLEWVSHLDNVRHAFNTGLSKNGEESHAAKLTFSNIKRIRKLINHKVCQRRIAEHFKITEATICDIKKGRSWKRSYENRNS